MRLVDLFGVHFRMQSQDQLLDVLDFGLGSFQLPERGDTAALSLDHHVLLICVLKPPK